MQVRRHGGPLLVAIARDRARVHTAGWLLAAALVGCNAIWGIDELDFVTPPAAGGAAGHGSAGGGGVAGTGSGGESTAGSGGSSSPCEPGSVRDCYEGPDDTLGLGECRAGEATCNSAGTAYGPCVGQVLPAIEICGNGVDEDCNDVAEPPCLAAEGLVARYFIDEATSGTGPTALADAAPNPLAMSIAYSTDLAFYESNGNAGLHWETLSGDGAAYVLVAGTKIYQSLHQATELTLELVVDIAWTVSSGSHLARLGPPESGSAVLVLDSASEGLVCEVANEQRCGVWPFTPGGGRTVLQLVYDSSEPLVTDRVRLYGNGTRLTPNVAPTNPALGAVIDLTSSYFSIGNRPAGSSSILGGILYVALYSRPLADAELAASATLLLESDDTP